MQVEREQERYREISRFILSDDLSFAVDFAYQDSAVLVNGSKYPLLKMDWVDGETLELYVGARLNNKDALASLRLEFRKMLAGLAEHGIAHGDLQHGNQHPGRNSSVCCLGRAIF